MPDLLIIQIMFDESTIPSSINFYLRLQLYYLPELL